jgi:hypothetical protein
MKVRRVELLTRCVSDLMHTCLQVSYLTAECKALFIQVVEFLKESKKVKRRMKGKQQNRRNHKF